MVNPNTGVDENLDRGLIVGIALVMLLMLGSAIVAAVQIQRLRNDSAMVDHTYQVIAKIEAIPAAIREAESGLRGYIITGDEEFFAPYRDIKNEADNLVAQVAKATTDNPEQQARLPKLRELIVARLDTLLTAAKLREEQGFEGVQAAIGKRVGAEQMEALTKFVDEMETDERQLLNRRTGETTRTFYTTLASVGLGTLLGLAAMLAFIRLLRRHWQSRASAAEEIWNQRERLRTTLGSIGDAVIATDADARVVFMNPVASSLTGITPDAATHRPLTQVLRIINETTRAPAENPVDRVLAEGVIVGLANHTLLVREDGVEIPIDDSAAPIRDTEGKIAGCVLVFRDITERKKAEAEIERLLANERKRAEQLRKLTDAALTLNSATTRESVENVLREEAKIVLDAEHADLKFNGAERSISHTGVSVPLVARSGQPFGYLQLDAKQSGEFTDDDRAILKQLAHMASVAVENADLYEELHASNQRKNEFLATLAHELRNPLAPIRNSLELMQIGRDNQQVLEESRAIIERQVVQMVRLIDDLLDISRISRGKIELRKEIVDLHDVIAAAVESIQPVVREHGHELATTIPVEPMVVYADPTRLSQVILNLINNAAKYTNRGGRIGLTVEKNGDHVAIRVRDNGIGIPPELLDRIFEMFAQVDPSLDRSQGGLGIGLTIVRRLVEMHGGTVEAHSAGRNHGSEFVVRLPLSKAAPAPHDASQPERRSATAAKKSLRVLAVDDNKDAVDTLATMLRMMGHDVQTAYDGMEAVDVAARFKPEVVLLDIGLPRLNGYEACRRIRELPEGKATMLVAITGWGQDEDRRRSREAGFDQHLVKPVDPVALEQLLTEKNTARHEPA